MNSDKKTYTLVNRDNAATHARHPYYKKFRAGLNGDGVRETNTSILGYRVMRMGGKRFTGTEI